PPYSTGALPACTRRASRGTLAGTTPPSRTGRRSIAQCTAWVAARPPEADAMQVVSSTTRTLQRVAQHPPPSLSRQAWGRVSTTSQVLPSGPTLQDAGSEARATVQARAGTGSGDPRFRTVCETEGAPACRGPPITRRHHQPKYNEQVSGRS